MSESTSESSESSEVESERVREKRPGGIRKSRDQRTGVFPRTKHIYNLSLTRVSQIELDRMNENENKKRKTEREHLALRPTVDEAVRGKNRG